MLYEEGARELVAATCEKMGFVAEALDVRAGRDVAFPISVIIEAVIAGYDKAADEAAELAAGEDI